MKKTVSLGAFILAGCAGVSVEPHESVANAKAQPHKFGGGVLVAESELAGGLPSVVRMKDCEHDLPMNVEVRSSTSRHIETYESPHTHCSDAQVLFDGDTPKDMRAADPAIQIEFQDYMGAPREDTLVHENIIIADAENSVVLPSDFALKPETQAGRVQVALREADQFTGTMQAWHETRERELLLKESEKLLADVRGLSRMKDTAVIAEHQKEIQRLLAKLRDVERTRDVKSQRNEQTLTALDKTRQEAEALRRQKEQEHSHLRSKLEQQAARILELEKQKQSLDQQMARKQDVYTQQLERLNADLKVAEAMAEKGRQELVLEAATKIAEAERLAFAAKMQEKASMEREAERLRDEADAIMVRAHTLSGGRQIVIPGLTPLSKMVFNRADTKMKKGTTALINEWNDVPLVDRYGRLRLEDIQLAIYEEDKTLSEILENVFLAINERAPDWRVQLEFPDHLMHILEEKWTIAAESRLDELLSYIAGRVQADHGVELSFQQFDGVQLLLVGVL